MFEPERINVTSDITHDTMTTRRSFIAGGLTGGLALTSGCLGFVTGSEPLEFESTPAGVPDAALRETGYSFYERDKRLVEESVEFGVERDIEATFYTIVYTKEVAVQGTTMEAAAFAVVSMPAMEVLGENRNPVTDMNSREVIDEAKNNFESEYGDIRRITREDTRQVPIFGRPRAVDVYSGVAEVDGEAVEILIHIAVVEKGEDLIILFGGHPRQLPEEELNVERLMESVQHPLGESDFEGGDGPFGGGGDETQDDPFGGDGGGDDEGPFGGGGGRDDGDGGDDPFGGGGDDGNDGDDNPFGG